MGYGPPPLFRQGLSANLRFILLVVLSLRLILIDGRFRALDSFRSTISQITEPVVQAVDFPMQALNHFSTYFASKSELLLQNKRLNEENQRLSLALAHLKKMEAENDNLRALLHAIPRSAEKNITREVMDRIPDLFTRRIRINRGSDDGILVGMPVIGSSGVIGQVSRVVARRAEVTLLTDHTQQLSVVNERTGEHFILAGVGENTTKLQFVLPNSNVHVGDVLRSSGLDHVFPGQIYAGRIQQINYTPGDLYREVDVARPDFSQLRFVTILLVDPNPTAALDQDVDPSIRRSIRR